MNDKVVERNGKEYTLISDSAAYVSELEAAGNHQVNAVKNGNVIARKVMSVEQLNVYTKNGNLEVPEMVEAGMIILTRANLAGDAIIDEYGHTNSWSITADKFLKKYDLPDDADLDTGKSYVAKPKGGIQKFIQVKEDIAVMVPWGENGELIPQTIDCNGYLNKTSLSDIYGIAEAEFKETYVEVTNTGKPAAAYKKTSFFD